MQASSTRSTAIPTRDAVIEQINANDRVDAAAPYVDGQAMLVAGQRLSGAAIRGVDPARELQVSGIEETLIEGSLASLAAKSFNIVIGVELARELGIAIGDKVAVNLADGLVTPAGIIPRSRRFTVSGIYRVGMYEFDRRLAFVNIDDAQRLYRMRGKVSGIRLAVSDVFAAPEVVREAAIEIGEPVSITDWTRSHRNFFRSIQITKTILFVFLLLIVVVAAFNIVSTLVMVVKDKQADIAILRTIGARPGSVMRIFVTQGTLIGVTGTLAGVILGVLVSLNLESIVAFVESLFGIKLLAADVYFISDLPSELQTADVLTIGGIALLLSLAATLYPAWRAARTLPAEALRYD